MRTTKLLPTSPFPSARNSMPAARSTCDVVAGTDHATSLDASKGHEHTGSAAISRLSKKNSRATTKGQNHFGTFPHFATFFHTFSHFFIDFPPGLLLKFRVFFFQKKKERKKTKLFCTLVVARLSSSKVWRKLNCERANLVAPYCATPRDYLSDTPYFSNQEIGV